MAETNESKSTVITKDWMDEYDKGMKQALQPLGDAQVIRTLQSAPDETTLTYTIGTGAQAVTYGFKVGDEVRVPDAENAEEGTNGYVYYKLFDISNGKAYWAPGGAGGGGGAQGKIRVSLEAYVNDVKAAGADLTGLEVTLTNTTDSVTVATKTWAGSTLVFTKVTPLKDYIVSVQAKTGYTAPAAQAITNLGIGEEVEKTFRYEADEYTVSIDSNIADKTDIADARVTVLGTEYADGDTFRVAKGDSIGTPTAGSIEGYAKAVSTSGKVVTATYSTDLYSVSITSNQGADEAISGAWLRATYQQDGETVSRQVSAGTVKVPAGTAPAIAATSNVAGYSKQPNVDTAGKILSVVYSTTKIRLVATSNQGSEDDAMIGALAFTVNGTPVTQNDNTSYVKVPTGEAFTVGYPATPTHYARSVGGDGTATGTEQTVTVAYSATKVSLDMAGTSNNVEGAAPAGAAGTVRYTGGTDQVLSDNTSYAKVPTGTEFTVIYTAVSGYATPASYTDTASGTAMTAPKATYIYGVLELTVSMSDASAADLARVAPQISINGGTAVAMTGSGGTFTANLEVDDTYTITFNSLVAYGYQTPAAISGTFNGGIERVTASYLTTVYTLQSIQTTKDGNVQGSNPQGAGVTVAYAGQTAIATLAAVGDTAKVPSNLTPTVAPLAVDYYSATAQISGTGIALAYATVSRTVSITSNQASDAVIAAVVATLTYTYEGETVTRTDIADGTEVLIPATATAITFTAPDVTGYAKTVSGAAISYATTILTVVLASDTGEADLSGVTKTVTDTTLSATVTPQQDGTYKIPTGHTYSVSVSDDVEGYKAPDAATGTAAGTTATVTMTYEEQAGFVDLGLPSGKKWAVGNLVKDSQGNYSIGAETDWGTYVSWGNIVPHFSANGSTFDDGYDWGSSNSGPYASTPGASIAFTAQGQGFAEDGGYDAARELLGGKWKMPTTADFKELNDNCTSAWVANYNNSGVAGRLFTSKINGATLFFPAAGNGYSSSVSSRGSRGLYWSRSLHNADYGYYLIFDSSSVNPQDYDNRCYGFSVRAVQ